LMAVIVLPMPLATAMAAVPMRTVREKVSIGSCSLSSVGIAQRASSSVQTRRLWSVRSRLWRSRENFGLFRCLVARKGCLSAGHAGKGWWSQSVWLNKRSNSALMISTHSQANASKPSWSRILMRPRECLINPFPLKSFRAVVTPARRMPSTSLM